MKHARTATLAASFAALAVLAGCGGGGSSTSTAAVTPGAAADNPNANPNGRIAPSNVTSVSRRFTGSQGFGGTINATVTQRSAAGGEIAQVFEDNNGRGRFVPGSGAVARPVSEPFDSRVTEGDATLVNYEGSRTGDGVLSVVDAEYARIGQTISSPRTGTVVQSYFAGAADDAAPRAAPGTGRATYRGLALGSIVADGELQIVTGDSELNADFGAGTISGSVTNIRDGSNGRSVGLEADLVDGTIDGVDYAGQVNVVDTATGASAVDATRSTFQGGFYGPNAEETAGTIDVVGTDPNTGRRIDAIATYNGTR